MSIILRKLQSFFTYDGGKPYPNFRYTQASLRCGAPTAIGHSAELGWSALFEPALRAIWAHLASVDDKLMQKTESTGRS